MDVVKKLSAFRALELAVNLPEEVHRQIDQVMPSFELGLRPRLGEGAFHAFEKVETGRR